MRLIRHKQRLDIEKEKLQNSRDFKEIALAITLLAGLSAFLLKLTDYFSNHIISVSFYFQVVVYFLVFFLLLEFLLTLIFLVLKGYLVSTEYRNNKLENISKDLFRYIFIFAFFSVVFSFLIILSYYFFKDANETNYYYYYILWVFFLLIIIWVLIYIVYRIDLVNLLKNISLKKIQIKEVFPKKYEFKYAIFYYFTILIIFLFITLLFVASSSLLMGSFSIEQFPQSDINSDVMTFTITETGMTYSLNYITLYKMNVSGSDFFQYVDNITINNAQETVSKRNLLFGKKYEGTWYLNINTQNLQHGTYLLHSEVTNDMTIKSIFGPIKKSDDKMFYVSSKNVNSSYNFTQ